MSSPLRGELVGRATELKRLSEALERGARCITVTGPAGVGKTRLVEEFTRLARPTDDAWFCDLAEVRDEVGLLHAVAALFPELEREPDLERCLFARLGLASARCHGDRRGALLVLDNFEQLLAASSFVARLCRSAPSLSVIITSRERLAIDGEVVRELQPLALPMDSDSDAAAMGSDAVRLLANRIHAVDGSWDDDVAALAALARELDGMPLAIELVAAWSRLLCPGDILERLRSRESSPLGSAAGSDRETILEDAISGTWDLMRDEEREALVDCAVFCGGFSVDAAEAVLSAPRGSVLSRIGALRNKSLLRAPDRTGRLSLYVSVRSFAAAKLRSPNGGREQLVRVRHAAHFGDRARAFNAARALDAPPSIATYDESLAQDAENLLAAMAFVESQATMDAELAHAYAELAVAVTTLHVAPHERCLSSLDRAIAAIDAISGAVTNPSLLLRVYAARGTVLANTGRVDRSRVDHGALLDRFEGNERAALLVRLGIMHRFDGELEAAERAHAEAAILLTNSETRLAALNRACRARLACDQGRMAAAVEENEAVYAEGLRMGDPWISGITLSNLAQLEQERGNLALAESLYRRSLASLPACQLDNVVSTTAMLADMLFEHDRYEEANACYAGAHALANHAAAHTRGRLNGAWSVLLAEIGLLHEARARFDESTRLLAGGPRTAAVIHALHGSMLRLAEARQEQGQPRVGDALDALRRRIAACTSAGSPEETLDVRTSRRIATRALRRADELAGDVVTISVPGRTLRLRGGTLDLARRPTLFRVVLALAREHEHRPGTPLDRDTLIARAWPDERILADAAGTRLRVAVAHLRKLGLRDLLLTSEEGYLLDPSARIHLETSRAVEAA